MGMPRTFFTLSVVAVFFVLAGAGRRDGGCGTGTDFVSTVVFAMSRHSSEPIIGESRCTQLSSHRTRTLCDGIFAENVFESSHIKRCPISSSSQTILTTSWATSFL